MFEHVPMPPPTMQFYTLGSLCSVLQMPPLKVMALATKADVVPCEYRDGVPVYRGDAVQKLCDLINAARPGTTAAERAASN